MELHYESVIIKRLVFYEPVRCLC